MTLTKWNRNGRNRSNEGSSNPSLMDSPLNNIWPAGMWPFGSPFSGRNLLQDFFDDSVGDSGRSIGRTLPAVNISETDNELVIEVAAPGMKKKDFHVEVNDNQLHIRYQKESKDEAKESSHWRKEFSFESFERTFALPNIVQDDNISASYNDGILRIMIPKKEEARKKPAKAVEIK